MSKYDLTGDYGVCNLPSGESFVFDKEDYELLKDYNWVYEKPRVGHSPLIRTRVKDEDGVSRSVPVTEILGFRGRVSHKNGDMFDMRKDNLEMRTGTQIRYSSKRNANNTTGIKGVCYNEKTGKYIASITYRNTRYHLGCYDTLKEATRARTIAGDMVFCHGYVNSEQKALAEVFEK